MLTLRIVRPLFITLAVAVMLSLGTSLSVYGQVHTTKNVTGNWEDANSWVALSPELPAYDGNLSGTAYTVNGDITRNGDIVMSTGLTVQDGSTLTVTGDLTASGGTLTVASGGTLIIKGSLSTTTGIVVESGARLIVYNNFNVSSGSLNTSGDVIVQMVLLRQL